MKMSKLRISLIGLVLAVACVGAGLWVAWNAGMFSGLRSFDPAARVAEATLLADQRIGDPSVNPRLIAALSDRSGSVRAAAADTLGKRAAPTASKPLARLLKDLDPAVRGAAAWSLWKIPDLDPESESDLRAAFADADPDVRRYVFLAAQQLARTAKSPDDPRVRQFGLLLVSAAGDAAPVVRRAAFLSMKTPPKGSFGDYEPALLAQIGALADSDETVRTFAAQGLPLTMKSAGPKFSAKTLQAFASRIPAIVQNVIGGDRDTRPVHNAVLLAAGNAARTNDFKADEPTAEKTRVALRKALAVPGSDVRPLVLVDLPVLANLIGTDGKFLETELRAAVANPELRIACINSLKSSLDLANPADETTGKMAVDLLRPLLKDGKPMVRGAASMALWQSPLTRKVGGETLRAELHAATRERITELKSRDPETRDVAAWCLSWTDREDVDAALASLVAAREDDEPLVKAQIASSIARLEAAKNSSNAWPEPSWGPFRPRTRRSR